MLLLDHVSKLVIQSSARRKIRTPTDSDSANRLRKTDSLLISNHCSNIHNQKKKKMHIYNYNIYTYNDSFCYIFILTLLTMTLFPLFYSLCRCYIVLCNHELLYILYLHS